MAIATRISPLEWLKALEQDPRLVATAFDVLEEANKRGKRN